MIICPKYFTFPLGKRISTCISSISVSLNLFVLWFVWIWILLGRISSPCASALFFSNKKKSVIILLSCFKDVAIMSTSSAKRRLDMQFLFSSLSLMSKSLSFQVSMSFSIADWRTELKKRLLMGSPCFVPRTIPNSSLSTAVSTVARWSACNFFHKDKCVAH